MVIYNDSGTVLSPNMTPIILHSINTLKIINTYDIKTDLTADRPVIAFGRPQSGYGACAIFFEYLQSDGNWVIRVNVKNSTPSYIIYIFSNVPPKTPSYGYCFYNEQGKVIYHNECLPLKVYMYDITKGEAKFDEEIAMQCGPTGGNHKMYYNNVPQYVPPIQKCGFENVTVPGYWEEVWYPPTTKQEWRPPKYEYQWIDGKSQQVQVPGYWETVTVAGYYKREWRPSKIESQWICRWVDQPPKDNYWGFGEDTYRNSAVGDKTIKEIAWSVNSFKTEQSVGVIPPIDYNYSVKGINKFCYIKCSIYDEYFTTA